MLIQTIKLTSMAKKRIRKGGINRNNLITCKQIKKHFEYPKLLLANIRSMNNKFDSVEATIIESSPEIAVFTETWLKHEQINAFNICNYTAIHRFRSRTDKSHGGGVLINVQNHITIQDIHFPTNNIIESVTILLLDHIPKNIPWFGIVAVYVPPCDELNTEISEYIGHEIDRLLSINHDANIYVLGDFNQTNLSFILRQKNFKQIICCPTRENNIIDKCFTNISFKNTILYLPPIDNSDHATILITPDQHFSPKNQSISRVVRKKDKSCYNSMGQILTNFDWSTWQDIIDTQSAAELFHDFLSQLYNICFPFKTVTIKTNNQPWINHKIIMKIKERNKSYNKDDKVATQMINNSIKSLINLSKRKFLHNIQNNNVNTTYKMFQNIKKLTGTGTSNHQIIFPSMDKDQTDMEIVSYFKKLANLHEPLKPNLTKYENDDLAFPQIMPFEIYKALNKLNNHGSSSPFDIPPFIYKEYAVFLATPIAHLINLSISQGICPDIWKMTFLVPIPKCKSPISPQQVRPISISSPIAKICEKFILNQILKKVSHLIDPNQFGGMPGKSISQLVSIYIDRISLNLQNTNNAACTIITDYKKAFDNVDHNIFMKKFKDMDPPIIALTWISSFLCQREQFLKSDNKTPSKKFKCTNGIPQGTVMGPFMFAIMVDDLMKNVEGTLKYVDDITVTSIINSETNNKPQKIFDQIILESEQVKLPLNLDKCFVVNFDFKHEKIPIGIKYRESTLEIKSTFVFLGIVIQNDLKWDSHINNLILKANKKMYLLYIMKRLGMQKQQLKLIYTSVIRSILEYGAPIWHSAITKNLSYNIEKVQNRVLRIIMGKEYNGKSNAMEVLSLNTLEMRRVEIHRKFALSFLENFPQFKPPTQFQSSQINTRGSNLLKLPFANTKRVMVSPIYSYIKVYNESAK